MELFGRGPRRRFAAPLVSPARQNTTPHKSTIAGQTARSTVTVDSFIDLAELLGW
jgi:hypothetical protein